MKKPQPWQPAPFTEREAYALQAWAAGTASDEQQKVAYEWVMTKACRVGDETFVESKPDVGTFLAGKRSVGLNIFAAVKWKPKGDTIG